MSRREKTTEIVGLFTDAIHVGGVDKIRFRKYLGSGSNGRGRKLCRSRSCCARSGRDTTINLIRCLTGTFHLQHAAAISQRVLFNSQKSCIRRRCRKKILNWCAFCAHQVPHDIMRAGTVPSRPGKELDHSLPPAVARVSGHVQQCR